MSMTIWRAALPAAHLPSSSSLGTSYQPPSRPFTNPARGIAFTTWRFSPHRLSALPSNKSDLLALRGVGPVNAALLASHHIVSIDRLQEIYCNTLRRDKEQLLRFLSDTIGIRNPAHCRSVADHLDDMEWVPRPATVKLAVEGNIGAGKSTFLSILQDRALELQDLIEVVPEPVEEWQQVHNGTAEPINLLDRFYKEPERYAYTFQHYVLLTRMEKDRRARSSVKPLRVLERSIFSDRLVFVRAMYEAGYMGDLELRLYDSWFSMEISQDQQLTPDGFIYLKARPETCIQRLRARNRSEEAGVQRSYLESLHEKHESWLHFGARELGNDNLLEIKTVLQPGSTGLVRSLLISESEHFDAVPASIKDNIVFLGPPDQSSAAAVDGVGALNALNGVPALVLDHDQNDILHDMDARRDYANKVKDFSQFVASLQPSIRQPLDLSAAGQMKAPETFPSRQGLTEDQVYSLKYLISDYRRLVRSGKGQAMSGIMPERSLVAMEGQLDELVKKNGSGRLAVF